MTNHTATIAAYIASNTPIGTRYQVLDVPGTELCASEISICLVCSGRKVILPPPGINGWATLCEACNGTGKDLRGCEWCNITHSPQNCPAIRERLMKG